MLGRMASRAFARVFHASWTRASVPVVGAVSFAILGLSQPISLQDRLLSYEERIKLSNTFKPHPKRLTRVHESNEESEKEEVAQEEPAQEEPAQEEPAQNESSEESGHLDMEEGVESAFDERTGEINWDCPCLGGMADGPCGEEFKKAFSCFVFSEAEPKGIDCIEHFKHMQDCFRQHPDVYADEIEADEAAAADASSVQDKE